MNPYVTIGGIIALLAAFAGTFYAGKHSGISETTVLWQAKVVESENKLIAKQNDWTKQTEKERQNAADREIALRVDIDKLHSASDGLRSQLSDTARRLAANTGASATDTAVTYADLFSQSTARYSDLAETCDRHVSDLKTLIGSWPR